MQDRRGLSKIMVDGERWIRMVIESWMMVVGDARLATIVEDYGRL